MQTTVSKPLPSPSGEYKSAVNSRIEKLTQRERSSLERENNKAFGEESFTVNANCTLSLPVKFKELSQKPLVFYTLESTSDCDIAHNLLSHDSKGFTLMITNKEPDRTACGTIIWKAEVFP